MDEPRFKAIPGSATTPESLPRFAVAIGDVDPDDLKTVTIVLKRGRDFDLPTHLASKAAPLTRAELALHHGVDHDAVRRVEKFAERHSLAVIGADLARRSVLVRGRMADVAGAFQVQSLKRYMTVRREIFIGREGAIYVPEDLEPFIQAVLGVDDRPIAARPPLRRRRAIARSRSLDSAEPLPRTFTVPEVAALYDFPADLDGRGQCIGLIELAGGFDTTDLMTYFSHLGLQTPELTAIDVGGGYNRSPESSPEPEVDIEAAGAVAPGASQAVYFARNTAEGFIGAVMAAVHDDIRRPSVISISWGDQEQRWLPMERKVFDATLQDAAMLGVTVLVASGDDGSIDEATGGTTLHVDYPAASPFALGCGGTKLLASNPTTIFSETVWNEGAAVGAGGGGVSNVEPKPDYQSNANVPLSPTNFVGRGVPDVSGNAASATGYRLFIGGSYQIIQGTSVVAPLYGGLVALINQARAIAGLPPAGFINDVLYATSGVCRDVIHGNNDMFGNIPGNPYQAKPGWDPASGLGSAIGMKWLEALLPTYAVEEAMASSSRAQA
jgi:kumamolisin